MAGMDYDRITFNNEGTLITEGPILEHKGFSLDINKNYLLISNPKMYEASNKDFIANVIATIRGGNVQIGPLTICSHYWKPRRLVWSAQYLSEKEGSFHHACGVAVYGHLDTSLYYAHKMGVEKPTNWAIMSCGRPGPNGYVIQEHLFYDTYDETDPLYNKQLVIPNDIKINSWVGVTKYDVEALLSLLRENYFEDYENKVRENIAKLGELPATEVNENISGSPSLFNMFFGKDLGLPENFDVKEYL